MSTIHSCWRPLGARSAVKCGTARYRTEKSIATRKVGTPSTASAAHSRRPALGPESAVLTVSSSVSVEMGPVGQLLDVPVERPALQQLEVEVGRAGEDGCRAGPTGED